jgi:hypothetical protein
MEIKEKEKNKIKEKESKEKKKKKKKLQEIIDIHPDKFHRFKKEYLEK